MQPRTAALLLLATAVAGQVLLRLRPTAGAAPGAVAFRLGDTTSLGAQATRAAARTTEVGPGEMVDLDRAGAGELARLPGVGPALAKRIVAERGRGGPFGGARCLDARVRGVGEGFLRRAGPHLRFSGPPCDADGALAAGKGPPRPASGGAGCPEAVDLAGATRGDLECLPGIGRARAESILAWRERNGGIRSVDELAGVPGMTRRVLEGVRARARVGPVP